MCQISLRYLSLFFKIKCFLKKIQNACHFIETFLSYTDVENPYICLVHLLYYTLYTFLLRANIKELEKCFGFLCKEAVSYTHLDVYKRQIKENAYAVESFKANYY